MHKVAIGSWINCCANYMADTNNIIAMLIIGLPSCSYMRKVCQFVHAHNIDNAELTELYPL